MKNCQMPSDSLISNLLRVTEYCIFWQEEPVVTQWGE